MRFGRRTLLGGYDFVVGYVRGVLAGIRSKFLFRGWDINVIEEIEREGFNFFEVVVVVSEGLEFGFSAIESIEFMSLWNPRGAEAENK